MTRRRSGRTGAALLGLLAIWVGNGPAQETERLTVAVTGEGAPVVLLPGLFGSVFGFRKLTPLLEEAGHRVIVVEPLGIGESDRPRRADYSLTAQAGRVAHVLDTLGVEQAVVVAHSVGASVAFRLAILRPELVAGILSIEGGPAEAASTGGLRTAMRLAPVLRLLRAHDTLRNTVRRQLVDASGDPSWVTREVVEGYTRGATRDFRATVDAFTGMSRAKEPWELVPRLGLIGGPVRLLVGAARHDAVIPDTEIRTLRESLPAFTVDSVPDVGHYIFEERPGAVLDAVLRLRADLAP